MTTTANLRIATYDPLAAPEEIQAKLPAPDAIADHVTQSRNTIADCLAGRDKRFLVIIGPCSIHDPDAAIEYAKRLKALADELSDRLFIVMRVYFEKPRTTVGWKGYINDPGLDGSCDVNRGLRAARKLLLEINELGLPCATEFLDPIIPQYISDLVSWAAIGARTTESQTHREMASGLSMPVGFKNATDGTLEIAINGMMAARESHTFLGITPAGRSAIIRTTGNDAVHVVLRGGRNPNYQKPYIAYSKAALESLGDGRLILVDCNHGNSGKDPAKQPHVFGYLIDLYTAGEDSILGTMVESNLVHGSQKISSEMVYGKSVTDACLGWEDTENMLRGAHKKLAAVLP